MGSGCGAIHDYSPMFRPAEKHPQKRGRGHRVNRRTTRPAYLRVIASTQPFASLSTFRKRHNRFHPGRSFAQRSLTSESLTAPLPRLRRTLSHEGEREKYYLSPRPLWGEPASAAKRPGRRFANTVSKSGEGLRHQIIFGFVSVRKEPPAIHSMPAVPICRYHRPICWQARWRAD